MNILFKINTFVLIILVAMLFSCESDSSSDETQEIETPEVSSTENTENIEETGEVNPDPNTVVIAGKYLNSSGQELTISNIKDGKFDFQIKYGGTEECTFDNSGQAIIDPDLGLPETAYWSEAQDGIFYDDYNIKFILEKDKVSIEPNTSWVGMDCLKFGNIDEVYTLK